MKYSIVLAVKQIIIIATSTFMFGLAIVPSGMVVLEKIPTGMNVLRNRSKS